MDMKKLMKKMAVGMAVMTGLCFGMNMNVDQNSCVDLKLMQTVEAAPNDAEYYTTNPRQLMNYANAPDGQALIGYNIKFRGPIIVMGQGDDVVGLKYMVFGDGENLLAPVVNFPHEFDAYINTLKEGDIVTIYGEIMELPEYSGYEIFAHHIQK